tara:strand:+ start:47 stop:277 length:231 start_codon:yes stop_codon:yes gene_type:complete
VVKDTLTKEQIAKLFPDNFQLTIFAIAQAQQQINSGNVELNVSDLLNHIRKKEEKKLKSFKTEEEVEELKQLTPND